MRRTVQHCTTIAILGLALCLTGGCDDETVEAPDGTCQSPLIPIYTKAGCGKDVLPDCLGGAGACASNACGCDGKVIVTCNNYSSQKYQFVFDSADKQTCKPVE